MEPNKEDGNSNEPQMEMEYKHPMLSFEKKVFMDAFEKDALIVMAKYVFI